MAARSTKHEDDEKTADVENAAEGVLGVLGSSKRVLVLEHR